MKNSIRVRLFLQVSAIFFSMLILLVFTISNFLPSFYLWNEKNHLADAAKKIDQIEFQADYGDFYEVMSKIDARSNISTFLYTGRSVYVYTNLFNTSYQNPMIAEAAYQLVKSMTILEQENLSDGSYFQIRQDKTRQINYIVYGCILKSGNQLEILVPKDSIETSTMLTSRFVFIITGGILLFSLFWAILFSKRFTRPLVKMNSITRKMAELDFSEKCLPRTKDEIGQLGSSINLLSDNLDNALKDLKAKNLQLEKDIEKERRLEQTRKEFISNVSHELKTPIAIIQGFAEGLELNVNNESDKRAEYCRVIIEEAQKMNKMVLELLQLSKYESQNAKIDKERFNIKNFIDKILNNYNIGLAEKGINVYNLLTLEVWGIGDVLKLEEVLANYLNNAFAHTSSPGQIQIDCRETPGAYRIGVFNTGSHIPKEELSQIWNSFYRVDKSHNRGENRVGLGLSIVKAVQELHGCAYGVENVDGGVRFWFDITKADDTEADI